MRVIIAAEASAVYVRAARFVSDLIRRQPGCVLGLAAGASLSGLYAELVRLHREEGLDFSRVTAFNLDEYVGLEPSHSQSHGYFLQERLWRHVNVDPGRVHSLDGRATDFEGVCRDYEQQIVAAGGIDLQILGVGREGQLGFHEPGSSLGSRTQVRPLTGAALRHYADAFGGEGQVPRRVLTMGVGTILQTRRSLLLAVSAAKAAAVRSAVEGPVTAQVPASVLQLHPDAILVVDNDAGSWLTRRMYYEEAEQAWTLLASGSIAG